MKAAQLALRKHAPSVAVLGTAALVALDYSKSRSDTSSTVKVSKSVRAANTSSNVVHQLNTTSDAVSRTRTIQSPQILATSDAAAERSASVAAVARFSPTRPIAAEAVATNSSSLKTSSGIFERRGADNSSNKQGNTKNNSEHPNNRQGENADDSYPTFTPYHNSLLKEYLTPDVWQKLSNLKTSFGTTAEDIIRAGVSLPIGASPPRRVGVLVGDAECYSVFKELLEPIISHYHGIKSYEEWMDPELPMESHFRTKSNEDSNIRSSSSSNTATTDDYGIIKSGAGNSNDDFLLDDEEEDVYPTSSSTPDAATSSPSKHQKANLRRHCTIINNPNLVRRKADPDGKYILSTRVRVARSLDGIRFPATMSRSDRRKVERLIRDCTKNFQASNLSNGVYLPVLSMTNDQNLDLIERHILFDNPNEWTIASGLGRDWPDGRAIYANVSNIQTQTPDFMIWINEEDHLRIMTLKKGGDIQGAFTSLMNGVRELERELQIRGWNFAKDPRLGYLVSCPTNVGTTMRASVHVRLVNLGKLPGFFQLVHRLKLEARGKYGETDRQYTGVFDISNAERLGKSEVHLINIMVEGVAKLIEIERQLENGESVNIDEIAKSI
eukprot:scaffold2258_cov144-Skeletonema_menzelii.AAC.1